MPFPYASFNGPGYFIGRQISVFGVTGITIDPTTGISTYASTYADLKLLGVLEEGKFQIHVNHEEISPCTQRFENNVIITEGMTLDISEIMPVGARSNLLTLMFNYDYLRFTFAANPTGNPANAAWLALSIDMVRGDGSIEFKRQKCIATLQMKSAGVSFTTATIT